MIEPLNTRNDAEGFYECESSSVQNNCFEFYMKTGYGLSQRSNFNLSKSDAHAFCGILRIQRLKKHL